MLKAMYFAPPVGVGPGVGGVVGEGSGVGVMVAVGSGVNVLVGRGGSVGVLVFCATAVAVSSIADGTPTSPPQPAKSIVSTIRP
jgi:hypothetical protein